MISATQPLKSQERNLPEINQEGKTETANSNSADEQLGLEDIIEEIYLQEYLETK